MEGGMKIKLKKALFRVPLGGQISLYLHAGYELYHKAHQIGGG